MNALKWIHHFQENAGAFLPPDWTIPCSLAPGRAREELTRSLAIFQLGETGDGATLERWACQAAQADPALTRYPEAIRLFIAEENRHAALLADMVAHLGGRLRQRQWTAWLFARVRKLIPRVEFEIQILLIAELIAKAYYSLLAQKIPDRALQLCCARLVGDEVQHVLFHAEFFRERLQSWMPLAADFWRAQFQLLFLAARELVWFDHGRALTGIGVSRDGFERRSTSACCDFLRRISAPPTGTWTRCGASSPDDGAELIGIERT